MYLMRCQLVQYRLTWNNFQPITYLADLLRPTKRLTRLSSHEISDLDYETIK